MTRHQGQRIGTIGRAQESGLLRDAFTAAVEAFPLMTTFAQLAQMKVNSAYVNRTSYRGLHSAKQYSNCPVLCVGPIQKLRKSSPSRVPCRDNIALREAWLNLLEVPTFSLFREAVAATPQSKDLQRHQLADLSASTRNHQDSDPEFFDRNQFNQLLRTATLINRIVKHGSSLMSCSMNTKQVILNLIRPVAAYK